MSRTADDGLPGLAESAIQSIHNFFKLSPEDPAHANLFAKTSDGRSGLKMERVADVRYLNWKAAYEPHFNKIKSFIENQCKNELILERSPTNTKTASYIIFQVLPAQLQVQVPAQEMAKDLWVPLLGELEGFPTLRGEMQKTIRGQVAHNFSSNEFNEIFDFCAYHSVRLYGLPNVSMP
jgi:hypothetical protein